MYYTYRIFEKVFVVYVCILWVSLEKFYHVLNMLFIHIFKGWFEKFFCFWIEIDLDNFFLILAYNQIIDFQTVWVENGNWYLKSGKRGNALELPVVNYYPSNEHWKILYLWNLCK